MSKIEPMSAQEFKRYLVEIDCADESFADEHYRCFEIERRIILAWIYAEARAREGDWGSRPGCPSRARLIEIIKAEVGWPEGL
jgi:hypothetical protein